MNDDLLGPLRAEPPALASDGFTDSVMRRIGSPPRRPRTGLRLAAAMLLGLLAVTAIAIREHRRAARDEISREIVALRREQELLRRELSRLRDLGSEGSLFYLGGTEGADYVIDIGTTPVHLPGPLPDDLRRR